MSVILLGYCVDVNETVGFGRLGNSAYRYPVSTDRRYGAICLFCNLQCYGTRLRCGSYRNRSLRFRYGCNAERNRKHGSIHGCKRFLDKGILGCSARRLAVHRLCQCVYHSDIYQYLCRIILNNAHLRIHPNTI